MEIDNSDNSLLNVVKKMGTNLVPNDNSIFLPQLKRFKNHVLTNLKKARTSQARISKL